MIKIGRIVCLIMMSLLALFPVSAVFAQEEVESIDLQPTYRKLEATAPGASFQFEVYLAYQGSQTREFDLSATGPQGWTVAIKPRYVDQIIGSIRLEPYKEFPDYVNVVATPPLFVTPQPGEYKITFTATSGSIKGTVDLTAIITATYSLILTPTEQVYNTTATAGKDNYFSIIVSNSGSGALDNINLSSSKPEGWAVTFAPGKIDSLTAGGFQTIDVNIKPAPKAVAGDYYVTLAADTKQTTMSMAVRVTVETPTIWGWVGIGLILAVIAGVTLVFRQFSRR